MHDHVDRDLYSVYVRLQPSALFFRCPKRPHTATSNTFEFVLLKPMRQRNPFHFIQQNSTSLVTSSHSNLLSNPQGLSAWQGGFRKNTLTFGTRTFKINPPIRTHQTHSNLAHHNLVPDLWRSNEVETHVVLTTSGVIKRKFYASNGPKSLGLEGPVALSRTMDTPPREEHPVERVIEEIKSGQTNSCEVRNCEQFPTHSKGFARALSVNTSITSLTLANWKIGSIGGKHLATVLRTNSTLRFVTLDRLSIGPAGGDSIAAAIRSNRTLRVFSSRGTKFSETGSASLAEGLAHGSQIEMLRLWYHTILPKTCQRIGSTLAKNRRLRVLSLTDGRIDDEAARAFGEGLSKNKGLKELSFKGFLLYFSITNETLFGGLRTNTSLEKLDIISSGIGQSACRSLSKALEVNKSLTHLSLCASVKYESLMILIDGFRANRSLRVIDLSSNKFTYEVVSKLMKSVAHNKSLTTLDLASSIERVREVLNTVAEGIESNETIVNLRLIPRPYTDQSPYGVVERALEKNRDVTRRAFHQAVSSNTHVPWQRSKLMVVGEGGAGKTAVVRSLLDLPFVEFWNSTIGIQLTETKTSDNGQWRAVESGNFATDVANRIIVTGGLNNVPEKKRTQRPRIRVVESGTTNEEGTDASSKEGASDEEEIEEKDDDDGGDEVVSTGLVNEEEMHRQRVGEDKEEKLAVKKLVEAVYKYDEDLFVEAKQESGAIRMSIWDYGGQMVFQSLHHLFLTRYGVYLLVFSLTELINSPSKSMTYIKHWVDSIELHAPEAPFLFVGTFADEIERDQLLGVKEQLTQGLGSGSLVAKDERFHVVSNKTRKGISELRLAVEKVTKSLSYVYTEVSVKWMKALDMLVSDSTLGMDSGDPEQAWVHRDAFEREVISLRLGSRAEVEDMLGLFHEFGVVLYFSSSESLKDLIICRPQWVIDSISKVIRDKDVHGLDMKELTKRGLDDDAYRLLREGITSRDLLEWLWDDDQVDYLISLMHRLLLMSTWQESRNESLFLIPSMTSQTLTETQAADVFNEGFSGRFRFKVLPYGVFERIICLCVSLSQSSSFTSEEQVHTPLFMQRAAVIWLNVDCRLAVRQEEGEPEFRFTVNSEEQANATLYSLRTMMRKVKQEFAGNRLDWEVLLKSGDEWFDMKTAKAEKMAPWFSEQTVENNEQQESYALQPFFDVFL